jgi:hypothetical protein
VSERAALEARWLQLTREVLPRLADARGWPVRYNHCFQRILLDAACGGRWYDHVERRPAYRHLDDARLYGAVALAEAVARGEADLHALNAQSLRWRR